jgi:predicted outer membrane repeat protein
VNVLWWVLGCGVDKPVVGPGLADEDTGATTTPQEAIDQDQDGFSEEEDCDDDDPSVYPGAPDVCGDDKVTDCERISDDGLVTLDGTQGFDSLQVALDSASPGSELLLCGGIYPGTFQASVPVHLVAYTDSEDTILEGLGSGPVLSLPGDSSLEGLTVRLGDGGGLVQTSTGTLTVTGCVLEQNTAELGGGLALAEGGSALLVDTQVHHNQASLGGGGIYVPPGATLEMTGTTEVFENSAEGYGGGIYVRDGHVLGGVVHHNQGAGSLLFVIAYGIVQYSQPIGGGGLASAGISTVTGTELHDNEASLGGGLSSTGGSLLLLDSRVHTNPVGGGLLAVDSQLELAGTSEISGNVGLEGGGAKLFHSQLVGGLVTGNVATSGGGGLYLYDSAVTGTVVQGNEAPVGGGVVAHVSELEGVTLTENRADQGGGLAARVHSEMAGPVLVSASTVLDNQAFQGGGLYSAVETRLSETELLENIAEAGGGWYQAQGDAHLTGGTVQDNTAADGGGGLYVGSGRFEATGAVFLDNTPDDVYSQGESYEVPEGEIVCDEGICQ